MSRATPAAPRRRVTKRTALVAAALLAGAGFLALGIWQVERRAWKLDLIERVDRRVHAPADEAPGPGRWAQVGAATDEYRHVRLTGRFVAGPPTRVQAVTERGSGFWSLQPLTTNDGSVVIVNRGFVESPLTGGASTRPCTPVGETTVTGLLRLSEPVGGFLRRNDPAADRWYSRDVAAIGASRGLTKVAPYFVDEDAAASLPPGCPIGGLTVVAFRNHHLVYALTWFALALMSAAAAWRALFSLDRDAAGRDTSDHASAKDRA